MSNILQHPSFGQIRTRKSGNEFLFCGKDLCDVLELNNITEALRSLDQDEKFRFKVYVKDLTSEILTSGQNREMIFVSESGLYALILRSRKPEARKFRKWITSEVLPALRKYGIYSIDPKVMSRAEKRLEQKKIDNLLSAINSGLSSTDIRLVARQCQTDEYEVRKVLDGGLEDAYMLTLLYSRATGNKILREQFYTAQGAEKLLLKLSK